MKLKVYNTDGSSFSEKDFDIPSFEGDKGLFALKETIVAYQANARQGNASTLDYGEVSGSCAKPFKQKGGGRSRHGTTKSVIHRGGAVVFGPRPRDWSQKMNRKVRVLALQRALFDKCSEAELNLIEKFEMAQPKTKLMEALLSKIQPKGKVLIVDDVFADNVVLSGRNIERMFFCETASLNALDLVKFSTVIMSEQALNTLLARISK